MLLLFRTLLESASPVVVETATGGAPRRHPRNETGWVAPSPDPARRRNKLALLLTALPVLRR